MSYETFIAHVEVARSVVEESLAVGTRQFHRASVYHNRSRLPYAVRLTGGKFQLLNRDYMPIGFCKGPFARLANAFEDTSFSADHTAAPRVSGVLDEISVSGSGSGTWYLFGDDTSPLYLGTLKQVRRNGADYAQRLEQLVNTHIKQCRAPLGDPGRVLTDELERARLVRRQKGKA